MKNNFDIPQIMGIVNVTPDSFSDGGRYMDLKKALEHSHYLIDQGADILDIGGESTRPGAELVSCEEELKRVLPLIKKLRKETDIPISIDTYKPEVALQCLDSGASIVNDITGLRNPLMTKIIAQYNVPIMIMHMPGTPQTMQQYANYENVTLEVKDFLEERVNFARDSGIKEIIIDPGFGFRKTPDHNYELLRDLSYLKELSLPILIGTSKKRFKGIPKESALEILVIGMLNGANIIRIHDVNHGFKAIERYKEITSKTFINHKQQLKK